jgi:hypothetical protein
MASEIISDRKRLSFEELFIQHLTDIMLEVKGIKVKAAKNDLDGINEHTTKIKSALLAIMDIEFERATYCSNFSN